MVADDRTDCLRGDNGFFDIHFTYMRNDIMRRTKKQIIADKLIKDSVSVDKNDLKRIKEQLKQERIEKLSKSFK